MLQELLGLTDYGWQVFLGNFYGAIAFHIIFLSTIAGAYFLFGKNAIHKLQDFGDKLMSR